MNILLINHYAGSNDFGMEYRPYFMGREWVKMGHHVTLLSASFAHVRIRQPDVNEDFLEEKIDDINYCWVKTPKYQGNGPDRLKNMISFSWKIYRNAHLLAKKFDPHVVIASSTYTYDNYAARRIANRTGAMYIYEVHDLWPLSPMELGGMSKYHPFIVSLQHAENFAYRNADKVISMLPKTLSYMEQHGLNKEKWHYVPNGIHPGDRTTEAPVPESHKSLLDKLKEDNNKIIMYTGSLGIANDINNLVEAARMIRDPKVKFVLLGDGSERKKLIQKTRNENLSNVFFLDPIPKSQIPGILSYGDILYIGLQNQPLFRFGISPNKMLDYMMAGRPIIQAIEAGNNMVEEADCGISIAPGKPDKVAEAISKILALSKNERDKMGINGRSFARKNHDYNLLAKRMIDIFQSSDINWR